MTNHTYRLGFAASRTVPSDQIAIVEVSVAEAVTYLDLHERFVATLTEWTLETPEGQQLRQAIDGPVTIGAILMALDSLTITSLEFWLTQAGLYGFRVATSSAVFDFDELIDE